MENDPLIDQQLGAYHIQSKIGEGGMARVYKGYHARLRRDVAIKVILSQIADQEGFKARFEREAQLAASLQHLNIVAVYDFGEIGNLTYLVMQFVGGGTLRDQLRGGHALLPPRAILYCQQMAMALHHAHLRGIVHRDVKPQNMLISATDRNQLLLSDFGIAKLYGSLHEPTMLDLAGSIQKNDLSLTSVDQILGTAEYISPEQVNGKPVDARTDVYALGVVLYQMLTGDVPFHSTTVQGLLFQHVYTPPQPVREINPYVPEMLGQLTAKAMAQSREDRFQSAEAMAQALETANKYVTNQLSSSLPNNLSTPAQNLTIQSPNLPFSNYGQQPNSGRPAAAPSYGQTPAHAKILPPRPAGWGVIRYAVVALVILLAIGLIAAKSFPALFPTSPQTSFTETFQNNQRNWTIGSLDNGNFIANVNSPGYTLTINNVKKTYFPHPNIENLSDNFTLTLTMEQTHGDQSVFYGLAFRLSENGSNVYCYTLAINGNGQYEVLKYDPNASLKYSTIWPASQPWTAIHRGLYQPNTLQAIVQGNMFTFKINSQIVQLGSNPTDTSYTDKDNPYTGGQLAILVAGPNTSFQVTSVQLATH